jgi:hypothetical protein
MMARVHTTPGDCTTGNIQGRLKELSRKFAILHMLWKSPCAADGKGAHNAQGPQLRELSGNIQGTFREVCISTSISKSPFADTGRVHTTPWDPTVGNIQGTLREHSGNTEGSLY